MLTYGHLDRQCDLYMGIETNNLSEFMVTEGLGQILSSNWCNQVRQRSSIFLLESKRNRAGKFLELSVINKSKRTFVIFPAGRNERGWAMIFDALTEIVNLAFSAASGALRRPPYQVTRAHGDALPSPPQPPPPPPGCCLKCGFIGEPKCFLSSVPYVAVSTHVRNAKEAAEELALSRHMQVDRGKQRVITELGIRASRSVSTQVYSRCNSFGNRRNRVRESNGCNSVGSVCKIWPPDALLVFDSSPSTDEAKGVDPALYEAKICGQATSNSFVPLARDDVVSHQIHRGSLLLDFHPFPDSLNLTNELAPSSSRSLPW